MLYGNSQQSLDQAGNTIGPATNLTATNMSYTSAIMGLRPGVQYYIRVDSENSILSSMSEVINATTLEARMFFFSVLLSAAIKINVFICWYVIHPCSPIWHASRFFSHSNKPKKS